MYPPIGDSLLLLADAPAQGGPAGLMGQLPFIVLIFGIIYFVMLRPQQKQAKEHQSLLTSLKKDDRVVTATGVHGRIWAVEDDTVIIEIARDVRVRFDKSAVRRRVEATGDVAQGSSRTDKKSRKGS